MMWCIFPPYIDCCQKRILVLQRKHKCLQGIDIDDIVTMRSALQELELIFQPWANEYDRRVLGKDILSTMQAEQDDVVIKNRKEWMRIKAVSAYYAQRVQKKMK